MTYYDPNADEDTLIRNNIPLVVSIAFSYKPKPPLEHDDLISVGTLGLLKAIRGFKPELGYQFSTLATTVINREILREVKKHDKKNKLESLDFDMESEIKEKESFEDIIPNSLDDTEKEILYLRFYLDFTYQQIGQHFGFSKQWISNKMNEILKKIRESNDKKA